MYIFIDFVKCPSFTWDKVLFFPQYKLAKSLMFCIDYLYVCMMKSKARSTASLQCDCLENTYLSVDITLLLVY